jgi:hypothetical protein
MESVVCFSTKICGRSRRAEEIPATPPKFFEEGSRGGRRKEGLAAAREHLDENHARATARASARQHTRGIRPNIRLLLEIGGRRGDLLPKLTEDRDGHGRLWPGAVFPRNTPTSAITDDRAERGWRGPQFVCGARAPSCMSGISGMLAASQIGVSH